MKRFNNVIAYSKQSEDAKKFVDMAEDYAKSRVNQIYETAKYSVCEINKEGNKIGIEDKAKQMNEVLCSELARRSGISLNNWDGDIIGYASMPNVQVAYANLQRIAVDAMTPILLNASALAKIAEFHYGGYGDVFEYELKDNLPYKVSKMGRRQKHIETQEKKKQNKTIATDFYGLTTIATLPQILQNEDTIAEDAFLKALSIEVKIYSLAVNAFKNAVNSVTGSAWVQTNWDEVGFLKVLRNASAWNGAKVLVLGDATALKSVLPSSTKLQIQLGDAYNTTVGYMSQFNTYDVLAFDVVADPDNIGDVIGLPTNKVYGIPMNGSKILQIAVGATLANGDDNWDNDNLAVLSTLRKELGVEVATTKKIARCDL